MANGHGQKFNQHWATKLNLSLEEYVNRDVTIQNAMKGCIYYKHAKVFPKEIKDYQKLKACRILTVVRCYRDWAEEGWEWDVSQPIYTIEAYSEENKFSIFRCTAGYFQSVPPIQDLVINTDGVIG